MQPTSSVVVGYDGTGRALSALTWAAREAAERGLPLRVIEAVPYAAASGREPLVADQVPTGKADHVLDEGIRIASTILDRAQVSGTTAVGHPAGVLVEASDHAALLVVGQRSQDASVSSAIGSTSLVLADRAHCPVVVARGATGPERCALPVVVGVTGDAGSRVALDFAAHAAQVRGVALLIVAAWSLPPAREWSRGAPGFDTVAQLARDLTARAEAVAAASEDHVRRHYPSVATRTRVDQVDAATALERASHQAGLLVVGARAAGSTASDRRSVVPGWGRVAQAVLGRAACPVAVVPMRDVPGGAAVPPRAADDARNDRQAAR
jgi:nucleotide-binding universal stress UspA family protein